MWGRGGFQEGEGLEVAIVAGEVFFGEGGEAAGVEVVFEVGLLDKPGEGVGGGAGDEAEVGVVAVLVGALGDGVDGGEDVVGVAEGAEVVEGGGGVFDEVVEDGGDLGGFVAAEVADAEHDAEGVEDVGFPGLVFLAGVFLGGEEDGIFEGGHGGSGE